MDIKKTITKNAQALIAIGTIIGMGIGVINFFILTSIAPIERRVEAIEIRNAKTDPLVSDFIEVRTDVRTIKDDIKDIKSFLGVR
jgi:hypothetical protein